MKKVLSVIAVTYVSASACFAELSDWGGKKSFIVESDEEVTLSSEQVAEVLGAECKQLVKLGSGTLFNTNGALAAFTGDIIVAEGEMRIFNSNDLGTTAGKTVVSNGATLFLTNGVSSSINTSEPIHIAGTGSKNDYGALRKFTHDSSRWNITNLTLIDDALIMAVKGDRFYLGGTFTMNGKTLSSKGSTLGMTGLTIKVPGHIYAYAGCQLENSASYGGSSENTITVSEGNGMAFHGFTGKPVWTLIMKERSYRGGYIGHNNNIVVDNAWGGPIRVDGNNRFYNTSGSGRRMLLEGNIYGKGGLNFLGLGSKQVTSAKQMTFTLSGSNSYEGVTLVDGLATLNTLSPFAISEKSPLVVTNAALVNINMSSYETARLPQIYWHATNDNVLVANNTIAEGFLKTGKGTITFPYMQINGALEVREGTVMMPYGDAGLFEYEDLHVTDDEGKPKEDVWRLVPDTTNCVLTLRAAYNHVVNGAYRNRRYEGYIWNRNATNETWSFAGCFDETIWLNFDGKDLIKKGGGGEKLVSQKDVQVAPGAHKFVLFIGNIWGGAGPRTCGTTWTKPDFGFGYDPYGRGGTNSSTYVEITDSGNGFLLTKTDYMATNFVTACTTVSNLILSGSGVVDFRNFHYRIPKVSVSGGVVTNANLWITEELKVSPSKGALKLAGASGTLKLSDGVKVVLEDEDLLDRKTEYVAVSVPTAIEGEKPELEAENSGWHLRPSADGKSYTVFYSRGMCIIIR